MEGIAICLITVTLILTLLGATAHRSWDERDYHRGWRDHQELMKIYEMSPDDEALLKELKQAVKLYIRQTGLYKSGDMKNIDKAEDFKGFKDEAWKVTVLRKEKNTWNG